MRRGHRALMRQIAFPLFYITFTLLLILWMIYLVKGR
jgi:hypothetical protein